jgi:hypothetical protein
MPSTIEPMIITKDLPSLLRFYTGLLDATETTRFPDDGPAFFVGLRIGNSDLGLVSDDGAAADAGQRMLISVAVDEWTRCSTGSRSSAGGSSGHRPTCRGGSGWSMCTTRTETRST